MRVALAPHQVAMVRFSRGLAPRLVDRKRIDCAGAGDGAREPWAGALESLRALLAHPNVGAGRATVVLSSHFVRYLTVPWSAELVAADEELAFARARFASVFGDTAQQWTLRLSPASAGKARLGAAVDRALLERLAQVFAASPLTLASVQPALMAQYNQWRRAIGEDAWLVLAERGRLLTAWIAGGEWRAVRAHAINGDAVALAALLEQERLLLAADAAPARICLAAADDVVLDASGLRVERLRAARGAQPGDGFALAMAGAAS